MEDRNKKTEKPENFDKNVSDVRGGVDGRYDRSTTAGIPGINTPGVDLPAFNPPVPNRAWTAMRNGLDIEQLSEEEKREMYYGRDGF